VASLASLDDSLGDALEAFGICDGGSTVLLYDQAHVVLPDVLGIRPDAGPSTILVRIWVTRLSTIIAANDEMQRWVDDAESYPRAVPARLRMLLDSGVTTVAGGTYFSPPSPDLVDRLSVAELEAFANRVSLDTLKPAQRLETGSDPWSYECVAMGIAFGNAVLALAPGFVTIVLDLDQERSSCVLRFTSAPWLPPHPDEVLLLTMTR